MLHASTSNGSTPASSFFAQINNVQRSASFNQGSSDPHVAPDPADVRRAKSMKVPGQFGGGSARRDLSGLSSFAAAGSNLSSPAPSVASHHTPPLASRHPLFAHHAISVSTSPTFGSDPGPSVPTTPSEASSSAFSPASAFLSHFSPGNSLRSAPTIAPDGMGARVLDYVLDKVVGRGGFSTVRKATHVSTGEVFACKIVKRDDLSDRSGSLERFEEEIKTWKNLPRHPSLLPLIEMHRTPFATFLIIPYFPGGSLLDVLKREGGCEKTAQKWFPGVVAAVSAMHEGYEDFEGGMLHGDLKLDNFLVDHNGRVVVCDFYMAQIISTPIAATIPPPMGKTMPSHPHPHHRASRHASPQSSKTRTPQFEPLPQQPFPSASLPYAPPELLRAPPTHPTLGQDIWALGVILHALLTGRLPFVDSFDPRLQMKILRGQWELPQWIGREWQECLLGCLEGQLERRWTIKKVRECDAVIGWREVKHRSRSRSRARGRSDSTLLHQELLEPRHADAQPVPIRTPRRAQSREPRRADPFAVPESRSRSASVSGSRSRSSGHGHVFGFSPDITAESLAKLENIAITRGRSTAKKINPDTLAFTRPSAETSRSASANRILNTAPPYLDAFGGSSSRSRSRQRGTDSPSSIRTPIDLPSPTNSRRTSRSRPRTNPGQDFVGSYEYRGELGVVDEEGMREIRGRTGMDGLGPPSRGGRSRSRKRLDL